MTLLETKITAFRDRLESRTFDEEVTVCLDVHAQLTSNFCFIANACRKCLSSILHTLHVLAHRDEPVPPGARSDPVYSFMASAGMGFGHNLPDFT